MTCGGRIPPASRRIDEILFAPDSVHNRYCPQHQRHTQPRTSLLFLSILPSSVLTYRLGFFPPYTARHAHRIFAKARLRPAPQSFSYGTVSHQLPPARPLHPVSFFFPSIAQSSGLCSAGDFVHKGGCASCPTTWFRVLWRKASQLSGTQVRNDRTPGLWVVAEGKGLVFF